MFGQRTRVYCLISFLLFLVLGFFSLNAILKFYQYQEAISPNIELTRDLFHFFLQNELKREWVKLTAPKPLTDEESPLKTFHISVSQKGLDSLNVNLPQSGKDHFVDAYMLTSDDQKIRKIKMRYRGDNSFHWFYSQKSLRIKLSKNDIYNMEKSFNLINPPMMATFRDYVYYRVAAELHLLSPDFFPVRVFVNEKYMGVYMYLSQVNESLLRKRKMMPGSIYNGDDGGGKLWFNDKYWIKKSARNKEQKENREDIEFFINQVNNSSDVEFYDFIDRYMDKDKLFKYIALDRLYGSNHHDFSHNHKIYFDPYKGKFQPLPWDLRFWAHVENKDQSLYPLSLRLKANPYYDAEIDKVLFNLLENGYVEKSIKIYKDMITLSKKDLQSDIYKDTATWLPRLFGHPPWYSVPFSIEDLDDQFQRDKSALQKRKFFLYKTLSDIQVSVAIDKDKNTIYFRIDGNSPVKLDFDGAGDIKYKISINGKENAPISNILYPGRKWVLGKLSYDTITMKNNVIENVPIVYSMQVNGMNADEVLSKVKFFNYITGKKIEWDRKKFDLTTNASDIDPYEFLPPLPSKQTLAGIIEVDEQLVFPENVSVTIQPGTTFRMGPDASIYFYGKVIAKGTKKKPIRFIAKEESRPWGLVAVQGKNASGSIFEYCQFENGSLATRNLIHYTAPFNIHDVDWFEIKNCRFGKNYIGDDSVHIAYSSGIIDNCLFENARSDGLDIDISDVTITNSVFFNSGNDGLDIMTTKAKVNNNLFINTGDKGASIGEWSEAYFNDNIFIDNKIGLEVKDKSRVNGEDLLFVNSREKSINLYNKNKRYDEGGFLNGKDFVILGNHKMVADKKSIMNVSSVDILTGETQERFLSIISDDFYRRLVERTTKVYVQ